MVECLTSLQEVWVQTSIAERTMKKIVSSAGCSLENSKAADNIPMLSLPSATSPDPLTDSLGYFYPPLQNQRPNELLLVEGAWKTYYLARGGSEQLYNMLILRRPQWGLGKAPVLQFLPETAHCLASFPIHPGSFYCFPRSIPFKTMYPRICILWSDSRQLHLLASVTKFTITTDCCVDP